MNLKNILQYVPILSRLAAKLNESYNRGIYSVMSGNHSMLTSSAFALCGKSDMRGCYAWHPLKLKLTS